ncbi:MAG: hypothetical protein EOP85_22120 [Verrucomicrobiaceae bacterium]|nr:MAG: hypothetical protein EOP85_22120 [Verrucomicrobiaceae bacterium]
MNSLRRPCCDHVKIQRQRAAGFAGWIVPSLMLVLMPKCPACFAAYVALGSGIGISLSVAAAVRTALIVLCVVALVFLVARPVCRRFSARRQNGTGVEGKSHAPTIRSQDWRL